MGDLVQDTLALILFFVSVALSIGIVALSTLLAARGARALVRATARKFS